MRHLIISRPTSTPPPLEMMPGLMQAFKAWREKWRPKMESFEFFVSGKGGWGVVETTSDMELARMLAEYPWQPWSDNEVLPTVNGDEALDMNIEVMNEMMAAMKPQ